jgi:hypothetical protein
MPPTFIQSPTTQKSECSSTYDSETDVEADAAYHAGETQMSHKEKNPNIVDWEGDGDPENALNWPARRKWMYIIVLASLTLLTCVDPNFPFPVSQSDLPSLQALLLTHVRTRHPSCNV